MSVMLISSSLVATLLIPHEAFEEGGEANGRALAFLAHEYLGDVFGTVYDVSTILILWFAGASAMAGLLNIVPRYLPALRHGARLGARHAAAGDRLHAPLFRGDAPLSSRYQCPGRSVRDRRPGGDYLGLGGGLSLGMAQAGAAERSSGSAPSW